MKNRNPPKKQVDFCLRWVSFYAYVTRVHFWTQGWKSWTLLSSYYGSDEATYQQVIKSYFGVSDESELKTKLRNCELIAKNEKEIRENLEKKNNHIMTKAKEYQNELEQISQRKKKKENELNNKNR